MTACELVDELSRIIYDWFISPRATICETRRAARNSTWAAPASKYRECGDECAPSAYTSAAVIKAV